MPGAGSTLAIPLTIHQQTAATQVQARQLEEQTEELTQSQEELLAQKEELLRQQDELLIQHSALESAANAMRYTANIQPVIPFTQSQDWNVITQPITLICRKPQSRAYPTFSGN